MLEAQRLRNYSLLLDTAARHLAEDPLLLGVQSARRLPRNVRRRVSELLAWHAGESSVRRAFAEFMADRRDSAVRTLEAAEPGPLGSRIAAELGIQLGAVRNGAALPEAARARHLWSQGHLSEAIAALENVHGAAGQRARLRAELATMSPGFALPRLAPTAFWRPTVPNLHPRILHVLTNSFPRTQSGYAVRSHAVLRCQRDEGLRVRAVTRIGYPVTVGLVDAGAVDVVDGIEYRRLLPSRLAPTPAARLVQMTRMLAREVEDFRPALLHSTTNYQNALVTRAVAESYGLPWVYEMRGVLELTWVASRPAGQQEEALRSEKFRLLRAKETEMAASSSAVVVLSDVQRDDLIERGVEPRRITIVPNAVDDSVLELPTREPAVVRRELDLPEAGFWVGSVSSLVDYEGFDLLLDAVAACRQQGLDARCLLVGDGVSRAVLEAHAARLGLGADVCRFPGRVPPDRALAWYQALDVFCVPRRDTPVCRAVTPIKPLTARALGRPVIASDLPALRAVIGEENENLFPAGDARQLASRIIALRDGRGCDSSPHGTPTWSANGRTYARIYEELL